MAGAALGQAGEKINKSEHLKSSSCLTRFIVRGASNQIPDQAWCTALLSWRQGASRSLWTPIDWRRECGDSVAVILH